MAKMKLTETRTGTVDLAYDGEDGERVERRFVCGPMKAGYVYEVTPRGDRRQVCEGLCGSGSTLECHPAWLAVVIRREYRRMRRAEAVRS